MEEVYYNSRLPIIGNQTIDLTLKVKGNVAKATGLVIIKAIDEIFNRLRVTQTTAELAPHD